MHFVPISSLREASGYRDRRSIKKWVEHSLGIALHRVGKNWCVIESEYTKALWERYGRVAVSQTEGKYVVANAHEQIFLSDLQKFLSDI